MHRYRLRLVCVVRGGVAVMYYGNPQPDSWVYREWSRQEGKTQRQQHWKNVLDALSHRVVIGYYIVAVVCGWYMDIGCVGMN